MEDSGESFVGASFRRSVGSAVAYRLRGHAGATLAAELIFHLDHSIGADYETCS